jgi:hypothetical protein
MMDRRCLNRLAVPGPLPATVSVPPQDAPAQSAPPLALVAIPGHFDPSIPLAVWSLSLGYHLQESKKGQSQRSHPLGRSSALVLSTLALCDIHDVPAFALSAVQPQPDGFHVRRRFLEFIPETSLQTLRAQHISAFHWEYSIRFRSKLQGLFLPFSTMDELLRLVSRQKIIRWRLFPLP